MINSQHNDPSVSIGGLYGAFDRDSMSMDQHFTMAANTPVALNNHIIGRNQLQYPSNTGSNNLGNESFRSPKEYNTNNLPSINGNSNNMLYERKRNNSGSAGNLHSV